MKRRCAYSLIELLIVVGTLVSVLALGFPIWVRAQTEARAQMVARLTDNRTCQTNLRYIGLAIMQYTQDWDERMPLLKEASQKVTRRSNLQPYIRKPKLFECPINPGKGESAWGDTDLSWSRQRDSAGKPLPIPISYAANANVMGSGKRSLLLSEIENPARLAMVGESRQGHAEMPFHLPVADFARNAALFAEHNYIQEFGTTNCLFVDGHIRAYRPTYTLPLWFNRPPDLKKRRDYWARLSAIEHTPRGEQVTGIFAAEVGVLRDSGEEHTIRFEIADAKGRRTEKHILEKGVPVKAKIAVTRRAGVKAHIKVFIDDILIQEETLTNLLKLAPLPDVSPVSPTT